MRFGSVCSGIEAASVAWHPLGWEAAFLSEIEAFPRAVLRHHFPKVPLHGDFTTIRADEYGPIDLLVGGTPCQSFSLAGLRGGLGDDRGNLALEYLRLVDRKRPRWVVWENVPGVLSSNGGRDFGAILGGLVELGYGFAYRVLDAQFFGVPQRRRRVFVVGHLGDWRRPAAVLFERHSLQGHPSPRRQAEEGVATGLAARAGGGGRPDGGDGRHSHLIPETVATLDASYGRLQGAAGQDAKHGHSHLVPTAFGGNNTSGAIDVAAGLNAKSTQRQDFETETFIVAHSLRAEGFDASEDGTGRGIPLVPTAFHGSQDPDVSGDVTHPLGRNRGLEVCVSHEPYTLAIRGRGDSHQLEYRQDGTSNAILTPNGGRAGIGVGAVAVPAAPLATGRLQVEQTYIPDIIAAAAVRRLTPRECERLQGFPDGFTDIPWRNRNWTPDGPRYKALGNSMAVPVMNWIGRRIAVVDLIGGDR